MANAQTTPAAKRTLDVVNLILGVWVFISPWIFSVQDNVAAIWSMVILGGAIVILSLWAMSQVNNIAPEWINILLGALLFLSPWAMSYVAYLGAAWSAWLCGAAVVLLAAIDLPMTHQYPTRT